MTGRHVNPTVLHSIRYKAEEKLLEVELHAGEALQYYGVPAEVYEGLMSAESRAQYFDRRIRLCYRHKKIIKI